MTKTCCILGCNKPHLAKGYCPKHYRRFRLHGSPSGGKAFRNGKAKAFFAMATIYDGKFCLLWPFSLSSHGYAAGGWDGKVRKVHREVCEAVHGTAPSASHEVAHICGVRACVNPLHLRWASHAENMADTKTHKTAPSGERSGKAKLNWGVVGRIRADFASGLSQAKISEKYGLLFSTVHKIVHHQRWISK